MVEQVFRKRLILEARQCRREDDLKFICEFLKNLCKRISMTPIIGPIGAELPSLFLKDRYGVSAAIIFLESGVQIHTWPEYSFVTLDLFSCKDFDEQIVIKYFKGYFKPKEIEWKII